MKAGVFRNGDVLIYVTSDQRVTAHTHLRQLSDVHPAPGYKVSYNKAGDTVSHTGLTFSRVEGDFGYRAEVAVFAARQQIVAPQLSMIEENTMRGQTLNGKRATYVSVDELLHNAGTKPVGKVVSINANKDGTAMSVTYRLFNTCGKQSARKHRKLGHKVTKISNNRYTWSK